MCRVIEQQRDIGYCNEVYMEHSAVLVCILASCYRRCRAFCVWSWIFPVVNIADHPGVDR